MGILSKLFGTDPKSEIEKCQNRIKNYKKNIEIIKQNAKKHKLAHYHESAKKSIENTKYLIEMENRKIASLKKQLK